LKLPQRISDIEAKLNALSVRERVIVMVTLLAVVFGIYTFIALDPYLSKKKAVVNKLAVIATNAETTQQEIVATAKLAESNPNKLLKEQIEKQKKQNVKLNEAIHNATTTLIAPEMMPEVLGHLLSRQSRLSVKSVKSAQAVPVYMGKTEEDGLLYRHELELMLHGDFYQVKHYLEMIETMPKRVYFDKMNYEISEYPKGKLQLNVYTLSTKKELIGVYR